MDGQIDWSRDEVDNKIGRQINKQDMCKQDILLGGSMAGQINRQSGK